MNRFARVGLPAAAALGLHAVLFLWPVPPHEPAPLPRPLAVSVVSTKPLATPGSPTPVPRSAPAPVSPPPVVPVSPPSPEAPPPPTATVAAEASTPAAATDQVTVPAPQAQASEASLAPEATNPPGPGGATTNEVEAWSATVRGRVDAKKAYPYAARTQGIQGKVTVGFSIGSDGRLAEGPQVATSSGYAVLDRAALAAVQAAAPFAPAPSGLGLGPWPFTVTLVFTLR